MAAWGPSGWVTNLGVGVSLAANVATAGAVATATVVYLHDKLVLADRTEVSAYLAQTTTQRVSIYVSNQGGTDIVVTGLYATSDALLDYKVNINITHGGEFIERGRSKLIASLPSRLNSLTATTTGLWKDEPGQTVRKTTCTVHLEYLDSKGRTGRKPLDYRCYAASVMSPDTEG